MRHQSFRPEDVDDARALIRSLPEEFGAPDSWMQLAVRCDGVLIGDVGVHFERDVRLVEIAYTIAPSHQRRGYASEAVRALISWLFAHDVHRIHASADPRNTASVGLLEHLGLRREGLFRQSHWRAGAWEDDVIYAVLASEWAG